MFNMATTDEARPDTRHAGTQKVSFLCLTEPADDVGHAEPYPHLPRHKA
jgi:hypothetical protein